MKRDYKLLIALASAGVLFGFLFAGFCFHFWAQLGLSVAGLCALAVGMDPSLVTPAGLTGESTLSRDLVFGLLSALFLYFVFFIANRTIVRFFSFGAAQVTDVYGWKSGHSRWIIGLLLITIVGPGEELFWRGYLQRQLDKEAGIPGVLAGIFAYGVVHIPSWNLMLIGAAFVCGCYWAVLYRLFGSVRMNAISHAAWGLAVFVLFPLR